MRLINDCKSLLAALKRAVIKKTEQKVNFTSCFTYEIETSVVCLSYLDKGLSYEYSQTD